MMRAPTREAIRSAELEVERARLSAWIGFQRTRLAVRAALARPATVAVTVGAAGLLGFWLALRPRRQAAASTSTGVKVAATSSVASLVLGFLLRYGLRRLPLYLDQLLLRRRTGFKGNGTRPANV